LGHPPADGGLALDQVDRITCIGDVERSLDASDAAADDQRCWLTPLR
jgi:hypothetical protein